MMKTDIDLKCLYSKNLTNRNVNCESYLPMVKHFEK